MEFSVNLPPCPAAKFPCLRHTTNGSRLLQWALDCAAAVLCAVPLRNQPSKQTEKPGDRPCACEHCHARTQTTDCFHD